MFKLQRLGSVLVALFFVFVAILMLQISANKLGLSTDEMRYYYFTPSTAINGNAHVSQPLNNQFNTSIFSYPRGIVVFNPNNQLVLNAFPGAILFYTSVYYAIGDRWFHNAYFFINYLILLAFLFVTYELTKEFLRLYSIERKSIAVITTVLLALLPTIFYIVTYPIDTLIGLLFFSLALYSLLRKHQTAAYIFFFISVLLRLPLILFLPLLICYQLSKLKSTKWIKWFALFKNDLWAIGLFTIYFGASNYILFGNPFFITYTNTGYQPGLVTASKSATSLLFNFFSTGVIPNIISNLRFFYYASIKLYYPYLLFSVAGLFILLRKEYIKGRDFIVCICAAGLLNIVYYATLAQDLFGYGKIIAESSVFRYFIPLIFLLMFGVAIFLAISIKRRAAIVLFFVLIVSAPFLATTYAHSTYGSLGYQKEYEVPLSEFKSTYLANDSYFNRSRTIVITPDIVSTEIFYPEIANQIYVTSLDNESIREIARVTSLLLRNNYTVVLPYSDGYSYYGEDGLYLRSLQENFTTTKINFCFSRKKMCFYKLENKPAQIVNKS